MYQQNSQLYYRIYNVLKILAPANNCMDNLYILNSCALTFFLPPYIL